MRWLKEVIFTYLDLWKNSDLTFYNICIVFQVTEELGTDELIRRLKTLAHTFQVLQQAQDESTYVDYSPLALHLADDFFLNHASRDVQLLVACCIADILRIFAPDAPYKDPNQIKIIFTFLIRQLG